MVIMEAICRYNLGASRRVDKEMICFKVILNNENNMSMVKLSFSLYVVKRLNLSN